LASRHCRSNYRQDNQQDRSHSVPWQLDRSSCLRRPILKANRLTGSIDLNQSGKHDLDDASWRKRRRKIGGPDLAMDAARTGHPTERMMRKLRALPSRLLVLGLLTCSFTIASKAETGSVKIDFTKAGFVIGLGTGQGILTLRGRHYPFSISGLGVGLTVGASTNQLVGKAMNLVSPSDIAGSYGAIGVGGAVAGGVGEVQLRNERGVILQLHGVKLGLEVSASVGRIEVTME
jgi:hypothetical protein